MKASATTRALLAVPAQAAIALVRLYQRYFSFLKPPACRYYPSCSEYAARAIAARGLLKGLLFASWRLLRCNPFSPGGYDPGPWAEVAGHRDARPRATGQDAQREAS